jgi:hypothetical protein
MAAARTYSVFQSGVVEAAAHTQIEITAPSDSILIILRAWLTQDLSETSTMEVAEVIRKTAAGTGTSVTPEPLDEGGQAFGGTARRTMTAEGTVGDVLYRESFNILNGWLWVPTPEERIVVAPSGIIGIRFPTAPTSITVTSGFIFQELG